MEESVIKSRYPNLRRKGRKAIGKEWGELNLKDGFEYFFELHGKYPTAKDVDRFDYLPSCRTMQRSFGGIMELRKILSLNCQTNFTTGEMRSKLCREGDFRAQKFEKEFFEYLVSHIPEQRVHEHKIIRPGNTAADFFIYTSENSGIVIDIFYAMDLAKGVSQFMDCFF